MNQQGSGANLSQRAQTKAYIPADSRLILKIRLPNLRAMGRPIAHDVEFFTSRYYETNLDRHQENQRPEDLFVHNLNEVLIKEKVKNTRGITPA